MLKYKSDWIEWLLPRDKCLRIRAFGKLSYRHTSGRHMGRGPKQWSAYKTGLLYCLFIAGCYWQENSLYSNDDTSAGTARQVRGMYVSRVSYLTPIYRVRQRSEPILFLNKLH